ncbi:unnamed protein product [Caenorhabditis bovis]|uniref:Peptidase M12B domain-containing protein n=1 Tax=Caenorhabditis bovis TaxID=2654633 RepID=A0A8S1E943_9PELO|nr:unnamed protein product [Caenorhabditis bovis]
MIIYLLCVIGLPLGYLNASFLHNVINEDVETEISDWSEAKTDGKTRIIDFLIGFDSSLTRYYNYDEELIKSATVTLAHTINQYFYPLNIKVSIVDIVPIKGTNMGLDDFIEWRKEQSNIVTHDVVVLLRHNYEGGIAYGNGICTKNSLIISGFFPESTMNNAWVLIHQIAHVVGLTHTQKFDCHCSESVPEKCLKIRGFPPCSVQGMVDKMQKHQCLLEENSTIASSLTVRRSSLPICGNGLLEKNEQCDCGPEKYCDNVLCDPHRCQFILEKKIINFVITFSVALLCFIALLITWSGCYTEPSDYLFIIKSSYYNTEDQWKIVKEATSKVASLLDIGRSEQSSRMAVALFDNFNPPKLVIDFQTYGRSSDLKTALYNLPLLPCGSWCSGQQQKSDIEQLIGIMPRVNFTRHTHIILIASHYLDTTQLQFLFSTGAMPVIQQFLLPQTSRIVTYDSPYYNYFYAYYDQYRRYASRIHQIYPNINVQEFPVNLLETSSAASSTHPTTDMDYEYEITADPPGMKINKTPLKDSVKENNVEDFEII